MTEQDVVKEILNLLQQEWYTLNNEPTQPETPRDVGIRVGRKMQLISTINMLKQKYP